MVVPMTLNEELGVRQGSGASLQMSRFKFPLYAISAGYAVMVLTALLTSNGANLPLWFFMTILAHCMASTEAPQCMTSCAMPFALCAVMTLFLDVFELLQQLTSEYPSAADFFSWSCPSNGTTFIIPANVTVYNSTNGEFMLPSDTRMILPMDRCRENYMAIFNAALVVALIVDIMAAFMGWKMISAAMSMSSLEDGGLGMGVSGRNSFIGFTRPGQGGQREMAGIGRQGHARPGRGRPGPDGFEAFQGDGARMSL